MKINYVKFFQYIEVPLRRGGHENKNYVKGSEYDVTLDGVFLTIKPKNGDPGDTILTTVQNIQFMKVTNEPVDTKAAKGRSNPSAAPKEDSKPS